MPLIFISEVLGGLGLLILGMKSMSEGLQKLAGERIRRSLERVTGNRLTAALTGSCLASLLQSSSAAAILVIGFVNAGLLSIYQALGVLLGTGLGATIAIQFIAFKVSLFALPTIFLGVLFSFFSKKRKLVSLGNLLVGAGLVFLGLQMMEAGFSPISQSDLLSGLQNRLFSWRISAVLIGGFLTFLIQSSSATTGVIIAMAGSGVIAYETGAAMVVGEVLGTALVALAASINGSLAAKRTAFIYFFINVFAVGIVLSFFPAFLKIVHLCSPGDAEFTIANFSSGTLNASSAITRPYVARHLANAHTFFNFFNLLFFLPLIGYVARTAPTMMPGRTGDIDVEPRPQYIDVRVINTPTIALLQAKSELKRMAEITRMMFNEVVEQFYCFDAKRSTRIIHKKNALHILRRELSTFLVLLSRQSMTVENSLKIPTMLHMVNILKHIGDQNDAVLELLLHKKQERIIFSGTAMAELKSLATKIAELMALSLEAVGEENISNNQSEESYRDTVIHMQESMIGHHMQRLTGGKCNVEAGVIYSDIISAFGKIADYCFSLLEIERELTHEYSVGSD